MRRRWGDKSGEHRATREREEPRVEEQQRQSAAEKRQRDARGMDAGAGAQVSDMGAEHSAGTCALDRCEVSSPSPPTKQRSLRVVYVLNDGLKSVMASSPESGALQCLQRACDAESALLTTVTFGRLDFGETSVLDSFYDAGVCRVHGWFLKLTLGSTGGAALHSESHEPFFKSFRWEGLTMLLRNRG